MKPIVLLLAAALAASPACSGEGGGDGDGTTVTMIEAQRFDPDTLTVAAGTTVTFVNDSPEAHTVTAYEEDLPGDYFASGGSESEEEARADLAGGLVGQESSYEVTFDEPGTYEYFCIPHEDQGMRGTVVVEGG